VGKEMREIKKEGVRKKGKEKKKRINFRDLYARFRKNSKSVKREKRALFSVVDFF
jgi:hypothetical protein